MGTTIDQKLVRCMGCLQGRSHSYRYWYWNKIHQEKVAFHNTQTSYGGELLPPRQTPNYGPRLVGWTGLFSGENVYRRFPMPFSGFWIFIRHMVKTRLGKGSASLKDLYRHRTTQVTNIHAPPPQGDSNHRSQQPHGHRDRPEWE
jgi:hypothetical protein